jgi:cytochrome bd ubiquinol oxidase subunit II
MVMFWTSLLAISILLYVLLDGADLGIGMLLGLTQGEANRRVMLKAVSPIWDGNETWLVVTGVILWGAFPLVYATLFSAFYLPLFFILAGLILRGVAFEFRDKTQRMRWVWDLSSAGGSLIASFMQGTTVGAMVEGLQVTNGQYSGGDFGWLTPFAVLCGVGLCLGYALLGACWLVKKCDAEVRDRAHHQIRFLAVGVLTFLVVVFVYALAEHLPIILDRWIDRPYLFVFPSIGTIAAMALALSIMSHNDHWPFYTVAVVFVSAFGTLALSFWPYMIPFVITIDEAAAPQSSLMFIFWGGVTVFPLMLLYTVISYSVFRGKVGTTVEHY